MTTADPPGTAAVALYCLCLLLQNTCGASTASPASCASVRKRLCSSFLKNPSSAWSSTHAHFRSLKPRSKKDVQYRLTSAL